MALVAPGWLHQTTRLRHRRRRVHILVHPPAQTRRSCGPFPFAAVTGIIFFLDRLVYGWLVAGQYRHRKYQPVYQGTSHRAFQAVVFTPHCHHCHCLVIRRSTSFILSGCLFTPFGLALP